MLSIKIEKNEKNLKILKISPKTSIIFYILTTKNAKQHEDFKEFDYFLTRKIHGFTHVLPLICVHLS